MFDPLPLMTTEEIEFYSAQSEQDKKIIAGLVWYKNLSQNERNRFVKEFFGKGQNV